MQNQPASITFLCMGIVGINFAHACKVLVDGLATQSRQLAAEARRANESKQYRKGAFALSFAVVSTARQKPIHFHLAVCASSTSRHLVTAFAPHS